MRRTNDPVAVIGAGPYGLSVAAHLGSLGVPVRVFGQPMSSWRKNMPVGMFLKSTPSASNLSGPESRSTLGDYCAACGHRALDEYRDAIPIDVFVGYGDWFAERHRIPVEDHTVEDVIRRDGGFDVSLAGGEVVHTRAVIVASGHVDHSYVPAALRAAVDGGPGPDNPVSHSSQHADLSAQCGRRVAVIGAGQSALESAALLHEGGAEVTVLTRARKVEWGAQDAPPRTIFERLGKPPSGLGPGWSHRVLSDAPLAVRMLPASIRRTLVRRILGPFGAWWLRDRVEGVLEVQTGTRVSRAAASGDGIKLELVDDVGDCATYEYDHVIAATGYRVDLERVEFLSRLAPAVRRVDGTGSPVLTAGFESSVPGLYFTGLASAMTFGPLMRFVHGVHFTAPRVAWAAAAVSKSN